VTLGISPPIGYLSGIQGVRVRPSFFGFVPLVNAFGDHADRGVAQPDESTDFLQCIIVPPLCRC